jgi:hypothetical protein
MKMHPAPFFLTRMNDETSKKNPSTQHKIDTILKEDIRQYTQITDQQRASHGSSTSNYDMLVECQFKIP